MSVHDAKPADVYVDHTGKLWRVLHTCHEPTVTMIEVDGFIGKPMQRGGGVSGAMWHGWKRIHRPEENETAKEHCFGAFAKAPG
jgi:hypothetical protein